MRLKVISDGSPAGTKCVNAETGETIENVQCIAVEIDAREGVSVHLKVVLLEVDIIVELPNGYRPAQRAPWQG